MQASKIRTVDADAALVEKLEKLAAEQDRPFRAVFDEALSAYLTRAQDREAFLGELDERWEEFERTGLHVTAEEADEWMVRLARGKRPPLPKAHT